MPSPSPAAILSNAVRDAIAFSRFPWIRPLLGAYVEDFSSVATLFPGDPAHDDAWQQTIATVQKGSKHRLLMSGVLARQLTRRNAPPAARQAAALLADPSTVAIVTGQQAGLFGGPLYTVLKAVTTIQMARQVRAKYGVPAIPIFWVDAEDHDWDEVRSARVLDREFKVTSSTFAPLPGAGQVSVGKLILDDQIHDVMTSLEAALQPTEFTNDVLDLLRRRYAAGTSMGTAFAGWIDDLLGAEGLVVFEADDPAAKPAAAPVFACEVGRPDGIGALVREAANEMRRTGHEPQIDPGADTVCVFYMDEGGRRGIRRQGETFTAGTMSWSRAELVAEIARAPERFSPNVALRPLVQDVLFPTVCYVAGPSELAYQAQLGQAYRECGITQPLLYPRASATILDSPATRFLERHPLPFESLQAQGEVVLNRLLQQQLPPEIDEGFQELNRVVSAQTDRLKHAIASVDPTLTGAVATTSEKITDTLHTLHNKIVQAAKRRDETTQRQFVRTQALTFPGGQPQERALSVVFFANRYGPAFASRLLETLPIKTDKHYLIAL